ncbi:MAG: DUF1178 family protein [Hyphomicrobiaceae bacterium]|nr:DUF1178 family protein [Hyphomicrobiaceae bacterium]
MIRYRLECAAGHGFEAWFASSDTYDRQEAAGDVTCPVCGDARVRKALMAPSIATSRGRETRALHLPAGEPGTEHAAEEHATEPQQVMATPESAALRELHRSMRALRDQMLAKSEYVGPRFAEEARKIHFEEAPNRGIHGEATREEVAELAEDGVDVLPLPRLPDDLS